MGMGYGANYADIMEDKDVEAICPVEHRAFMVTLKSAGIDINEFACNLMLDESNGPDAEIAYNLLCEEFEKKTGLYLSLGYHGADDGDRYDDVRDAFWSVDGVYELSEAGKKLASKIKRAFYVTFG